MAYGGDVDRRAFALTINWVFTCISIGRTDATCYLVPALCLPTTAAVTLRIVSRRLLDRIHLDLDDGMILFAMAVILTRTIWLTINVSMGFGKHLHVLLKEDVLTTIKLGKSSYGLTALSLWTFVLPKVPVVALLVRLFTTNGKRLSRTLWSTLAVLIVWNGIMTILTFVKCDPVRKNWQPQVLGKCWDPRIYLYMGYFSGGNVHATSLQTPG
jgi:hypothetical protein